jgi:hypothetical protein
VRYRRVAMDKTPQMQTKQSDWIKNFQEPLRRIIGDTTFPDLSIGQEGLRSC